MNNALSLFWAPHLALPWATEAQTPFLRVDPNSQDEANAGQGIYIGIHQVYTTGENELKRSKNLQQ